MVMLNKQFTNLLIFPILPGLNCGSHQIANMSNHRYHDQQKNQEKNKDKIFLGLEILTLLEFMIPKQRIKGPHKCYSAIDYNHNLPMFHNQ